ncbi:MAG TPA: phosphate ABC transporter substrate-binding protein PstS [Rhizomicrobium sp.]|nr:phosphate ABC transporter substrate-binding protein PstS [Rhizomicrobium sp.]HEX4533656.1 phosphate ABC transporter substrate-binding protein PstS [Rhizomicrobium sp.]
MKPLFKHLAGFAAGAALACAATAATAADLSGAGATFPYPIYAKWAEAYKAKTGIGLNYQSIGSGGGIAQIKAKTVDFGASDKPLSPGELDAAGLTQFPTVIGGVVPVANIPGIKPGELQLDGPTLAAICLGTVKYWDDAAIKKLNPSANLPHLAVVGVHRSDGSGTNFIFTNYLSKVSPAWASQVGAATSVEWPSGIGAKGNEGVAGNVKQTQGAIGYVEYAYAKQNTLTYLRMINHDGVAVSPTADAFQAASAKTDWAHAPGFYVVLTNQPGHDAWPIAGATFILVYKHPADAAKTKQVLSFFQWAYANGDGMAKSLDYVPLPDSTIQAIDKSWHANIDAAAMP